jgi:ABC-2 type transport system ATP-binding protein
MEENMLVCKDVVKKYLNKTAVDGMSMTIEPGKIYALLGENGSGKTTWMKMVAGLSKQTSGTILFNNMTIGVETKKKIAYMSTEPFFYSYMTALDVGKYYADFFEDFDMKGYEELIAQMHLKMTDKASKLSSGLSAKLKIAATMARKAEIYLLDEPLNGIDIIAREHIVDTVINAAAKNSAIVMSSHQVEELEKIVNVALFIKDGKVILTSDAEELREKEGKSIVDKYKELFAY